MKKISKINWNRYKESESGKKAIALFDKIASDECTMKEIFEVAKKYNPQLFSNLSKKEEENQLAILDSLNDLFSAISTDEDTKYESSDDYVALYYDITKLIIGDIDTPIKDMPQSNFKSILGLNTLISLLLYAYFPEFYVPNLFVMQFIYLKKIAVKYEIELPPTPNRSDYKERWFYYLDLAILINNFAVENEIESAAELCAFFYDYELPVAKEEVENEDTKDMPDIPGQAWILVGNYGEGEKTMKHGFWQANEFTEKGDILLFYEKSPVKALNSVWIAQQNGIIDPFFHYYSNTYIGGKITIPAEQAITFDDFKKSEYFKNRDKKGNFVSKNFQDVSGWPVTYADYQEIKRMLKSKGYDISKLPQLYEPGKIGNIIIENESDVSQKLLIPLLEQMGWKNGVDFKGEVKFNAGRGKTGYKSDKRPDFCLHIIEKNDDVEAKVAIEVKELMKNSKEVHANFVQGRSYAKWGAVEVLVLCDMRQILVYPRQKDKSFNENKYIKFSWQDMENPDKYAELKRLLS